MHHHNQIITRLGIDPQFQQLSALYYAHTQAKERVGDKKNLVREIATNLTEKERAGLAQSFTGCYH